MKVNAGQEQGHVQCGCPVDHGYRTLGAGESRQVILETVDELTH